MIDVADSNAVYYYHFDGLGSVVTENIGAPSIETSRLEARLEELDRLVVSQAEIKSEGLDDAVETVILS